MQTITTIGLDIAKSVFQVHGVDTASRIFALATASQMASASVASFFCRLT